MRDISQPWYEHPVPGAKRQGKFGEIFPEDEFYGWMKVADDFDLIWLTPEFIQTVRQKLASSPFANEVQLKKLGPGKGWQAKPISPRFFMGKNGTPLT